MIKRTIYFSNPCKLNLQNKQMISNFINVEKQGEVKNNSEDKSIISFHIEDLGMIILDHPQITLTHALIEELTKNNVVIVSCNDKHLPAALMLTLHSNTLQQERYTCQISASVPLKKQLWTQVVKQKIINQANLLKKLKASKEAEYLLELSNKVKSGDKDNREAHAALIYWRKLFDFIENFVRNRNGIAPNDLLNYSYAILRATIARSLVETGLMPTLGIHHHNRYNAYCLADDIMEPYRPYVDEIVYNIVIEYGYVPELSKEIKNKLLGINYVDCKIADNISPLQIATLKTAQSLLKCFEGSSRKLILPFLI